MRSILRLLVLALSSCLLSLGRKIHLIETTDEGNDQGAANQGVTSRSREFPVPDKGLDLDADYGADYR